jgi:hypothetical protein
LALAAHARLGAIHDLGPVPLALGEDQPRLRVTRYAAAAIRSMGEPNATASRNSDT